MNDRQFPRCISRRDVGSHIREDKSHVERRETTDNDTRRVVADRAVIGTAQSAVSKGTTFQWSAELVAADSSPSTFTVKSRIAYEEAVSELKQFKPGEQVWIVWSAIQTTAMR
jgi:hypothetical protein